MYEDDSNSQRYGALDMMHAVVPWIALIVIAWVVFGAWGAFQRASQKSGSGPSSVVATSTASGTSTASASATSTAKDVVGLEAVARVALKLRALPNDSSEILASAEKGDVLEILVKDAGHFKVKDSQGHVGWIPNDTDVISVRNKK